MPQCSTINTFNTATNSYDHIVISSKNIFSRSLYSEYLLAFLGENDRLRRGRCPLLHGGRWAVTWPFYSPFVFARRQSQHVFIALHDSAHETHTESELGT